MGALCQGPIGTAFSRESAICMVRPSPGSPVRGVIFDLDGTLVDSAARFRPDAREMGLPRAGLPARSAIEAARRAGGRSAATRSWPGTNGPGRQPGDADAGRAGVSRARSPSAGSIARSSRATAGMWPWRRWLACSSTSTRSWLARMPPPSPTPRQSGESARPGNWRRPRWRSSATFASTSRRAIAPECGRCSTPPGKTRSPPTVRAEADYCLRSFAAASDLLSWLAEPL